MKPTQEYKVDLNSAVNGMLEEAEKINKMFSELSAEQINWKPSEDAWSIGQCLDHLIVTHGRYCGCFSDLSEGKEMSFWQKYSPISGMMGNEILKSVVPDNYKKTKTFPVFEPSQNEIRADIVKEYQFQLQGFIHMLNKLQELDIDKTIIISPVNTIITYSLRDAFSILYHHDRRHINQAKHILEHKDFPAK